MNVRKMEWFEKRWKNSPLCVFCAVEKKKTRNNIASCHPPTTLKNYIYILYCIKKWWLNLIRILPISLTSSTVLFVLYINIRRCAKHAVFGQLDLWSNLFVSFVSFINGIQIQRDRNILGGLYIHMYMKRCKERKEAMNEWKWREETREEE